MLHNRAVGQGCADLEILLPLNCFGYLNSTTTCMLLLLNTCHLAILMAVIPQDVACVHDGPRVAVTVSK